MVSQVNAFRGHYTKTIYNIPQQLIWDPVGYLRWFKLFFMFVIHALFFAAGRTTIKVFARIAITLDFIRREDTYQDFWTRIRPHGITINKVLALLERWVDSQRV